MFRLIIFIFTSSIIQIQVIPKLGIHLDLLASVTICAGLLYGMKRGVWTGIIAGLLQDVFSNGIFGFSAIGLTLCGALAGYCNSKLVLRYWLVRVFLVFLLTMLNVSLFYLLFISFNPALKWGFDTVKTVYLCIGNAVFCAVVFWVIDRNG